ncbi:MAG: hypothetical protein VSS75_012670 [Candidatus Parabeggiatoa sp.]|nr:hypothetical protein [Candidatus Parabeggiatoa sp.]
MKNKLRTLVKDYAEGKLDKEPYLQQRTELINGIVKGKISKNTLLDSQSIQRLLHPTPKKYKWVALLFLILILSSLLAWFVFQFLTK